MLIEDRVPASGGVEESGVKVSICEKHCNACSENGEGEEKEDGRD